MSDIRIIALDLDGTLLNSDKELSPAAFAALEEAAAKGIEIVPTTGRFYGGMPEVIRDLPFLHYAITINGAQVYDIRKEKAVSICEIPWQRAVEIMSYLDTLPVIYDCYMDNQGWMTRSLQEQSPDFAPNIHYLKMLLELRRPVDELKAFLTERKHDVQKIQFFIKDMALHRQLSEALPAMLPDISVSSSVRNNIELNALHANKGEALKQLADYLGCSISQTLAFGDGANDLSMIRMAGIGVAMENAADAVKAAADAVTLSNDADGVAVGIRRYCL